MQSLSFSRGAHKRAVVRTAANRTRPGAWARGLVFGLPAAHEEEKADQRQEDDDHGDDEPCIAHEIENCLHSHFPFLRGPKRDYCSSTRRPCPPARRSRGALV